MMVYIANMNEHIKITFVIRETRSVQLPYKQSKQTSPAKSLESGAPTEEKKITETLLCIITKVMLGKGGTASH